MVYGLPFLKMVIFYSYVKLPEGKVPPLANRWNLGDQIVEFFSWVNFGKPK